MSPPSPAVLQLGDPRLRQPAAPVADPRAPAFRDRAARLQAALAAFRAEHGFGRAIAAPQIAVAERFIAVDLGRRPFLLINPEITWRSAETFTLWDDCMSFPSLLVRVRRHAAISVTYQDEHGGECIWSELEPAEAELVQHEIDHLDGTLAVDRAEAVSDIITRAAYAADPDRFNAQVDSAPTAIAARPDRPRNPSRTADPRRPD